MLHRCLNLLGIVGFVLLAVVTYGQASGAWRLAPVLSGSMDPAIKQGSMVVVEQVDIHDLRVGDVMLFNAPIDGHPAVVHRVHEIGTIDGRPAFRTKGDANRTRRRMDDPAQDRHRVAGDPRAPVARQRRRPPAPNRACGWRSSSPARRRSR